MLDPRSGAEIMRPCSARNRRTRPPRSSSTRTGRRFGDGCTVREAARATAPAVVMAHGYNCIKELYLDRYAAAIANAGHVVLAYDHRNFGDSDGEPRQELDPWMQVRDYRNAITFVQTLDGVAPERIGIWGTSYAGGHVLVVAAIDRRVRCVVAQVPTISGWQTTLRRIAPQALPGQRDAWDADRLERYKGNPPKMVPMVVDPAAGGAASHGSADAWEFFTGKNAPEKDKWRFKKWRNETTLRSLEMYRSTSPAHSSSASRRPRSSWCSATPTSSAPPTSAWRRSTAPASLSGWSSIPAVTSRLTPTSSTARRRPPPSGSRSTCGPDTLPDS